MYSEADTRSKFIDPQLAKSGREEQHIVREYIFTDGRKLVGNTRGERCIADYVLKLHGINLAIIEAKAYDKQPTQGLEQVKHYGKKLQVRFVYTTNGQKIYEFDLQSGKGCFVTEYPTPEYLYVRIIGTEEVSKRHLLSQPYYLTAGLKPRYYQEIAVQNALSAIAEGAQRILLTLATGTGKTFIAFQIVYKLFQAKRSRDGYIRRPRVLFLADRNILVNQAMNTFNPLEHELVKITGKEIKKRNGKVPTNAGIFFAIYQAIVGDKGKREDIGDFMGEENYEEEAITHYFKQYPSDFFDLVIIDECHRGGANETGSRHEVLKYFSSAVHLGMTATPKRDDNIDTYNYFGNPVYEYSLKEGINDGFLSPYKVKRIQTSLDEFVLTPNDTILRGEVEQHFFTLADWDRKIVSQERCDMIAEAILQHIHPLEKTIVFCVDQAHALRMRDSINTYKTVSEADYCVRVTSDEGEIGRNYLEKFQDNDTSLPTILTSSQMLTTGVDAKNVRNIVLLRTIGSVVEFKQIIGRGTRVFEGKDFFTIVDFTGATKHFDEWDGTPDPLPPEGQPSEKESRTFTEPPPGGGNTSLGPALKEKLEIRLADERILRITNVETRYLDDHGKPLSTTEFLCYLFNQLPDLYTDEDQLRTLWANPETREGLLTRLQHIGIDEEQLANLKKMFEAEDSDIFDILAHISFNANIKKRVQRVEYVRNHQIVLEEYQNLQAKEFLEFILEQYVRYGIVELQARHLGKLVELYHRGSVSDMAKVFGGGEKLKGAYYALQAGLYEI